MWAMALVLAVLAGAGFGFLLCSMLPPESVAGWAFKLAGRLETGTLAQDLLERPDERLRFSGAVLLALVAAAVVLRTPLQELLAAGQKDLLAVRIRRALALTYSEPLLPLLALGALLLRAPFLDLPMRTDEARTVVGYAAHPLYYGLSVYIEPNNHLLNTLLIHVSSQIFGDAPWAVRLPVLVAGSLLVPATYALGLQLFGRWPALMAAAAVAGSSYLTEYSTNARGYALQTLSFVLVFSLIVRAVRRDSLSALLSASLVAALGFYSVPTMLYGLVIVAVWVLTQRPQLRQISTAHWLGAIVLLSILVFILYLPVVLISGPGRLLANPYVAPLPWAEVAGELPASLARTWALWNREIPAAVAALLFLGCVITTVRRPEGPVPIVAIVVLTCLALLVVQRVVPFERVWLFLLPVYLIVACAGLVWLAEAFARGRLSARAMHVTALIVAAGLGSLTVASGSILSAPDRFPDAEPIAQRLAGQIGVDDLVLVPLAGQVSAGSVAPILQYYFARIGVPPTTLWQPPASAGRLFVVLPLDAASGVLPDLMRSYAVPLEEWGPPVPEARYARSELYMLERR